MKIKKFHLDKDLLISFLLPMVIMGIYFAFRKMAPFGRNSILTVDLGQQYVDFFAFFRNAILHHPGSFLYSFSKGLGGEMWGTSAYYLFSPLNFVLILFSNQYLPAGILFILLLKYGLAGLSFGWLLKREKLQTGLRLWAFTLAYSMMGWMIANQLNLLWLDVLYCLPVVLAGLIDIIKCHSYWLYIFSLAITMIINYYMAWMVCLFTILFLIWQITRQKYSRQQQIQIVKIYLVSSLTAALLSAVVLLPTIYSLMQSKGTYTEQQIKWTAEYNPLKIIAKFVPGAFNFDQMPSGQPNIYIGMLFLIGGLLYLFNSHERILSRVIAGIISLFFICSFFIQPFDLLWHLGQFPVWYPSRFSFLFSFWVLWLAAITLQPTYHLSVKPLATLVTICVICITYLIMASNKISYISVGQIAVGGVFFFISLALLSLNYQEAPRLINILFLLIVSFDITINAVTSLNNISYVSQDEFANYTNAMLSGVNKTKKNRQVPYRIAKNFMRTKDDPFQADFYSGDHFGSTMEPTTSNFMGTLGEPSGDGFVTYSNGTRVTDSLLSFRYLLQAKHHGENTNGSQVLPITSTRPDWRTARRVAQSEYVNIRNNSQTLPFAFVASNNISNLKTLTLDPLSYQSQVYKTLAGQPETQELFSVQNFDSVTFNNVQKAQQITGTTFHRQNRNKAASVTLHVTPTSNDSYYLTLGPSIKKVTNIYLNGHQLDQYPTYHNTIVVNIAAHQKGRPVSIKLVMKKQVMWLQNVSLYRLNEVNFIKDSRILNKYPLKVTKFRQNSLSGTVNVPNNQSILMTSIPYAPGWHVTVDGHKVSPEKIIGTFIGVPIQQGHHKVKMTFIPPYLTVGLVISLITLSVCLVLIKREK